MSIQLRSYSQYPATLLNGTQIALAPGTILFLFYLRCIYFILILLYIFINLIFEYTTGGTVRNRFTDMVNHALVGQTSSAGDGNFCAPSDNNYCERYFLSFLHLLLSSPLFDLLSLCSISSVSLILTNTLPVLCLTCSLAALCLSSSHTTMSSELLPLRYNLFIYFLLIFLF